MSNLPIIQKTVDNVSYEFSLLPVKQAKKVLFILTQVIMPSIGNALSKIQNINILDAEIEKELFPALGNAITTLASKLTEQDLNTITDVLLPYIQIDNGKGGYRTIILDEDFAGRLFSFYKVIFASLEVNFTDFLEGMQPLLEKINSKKPNQTLEGNSVK